MCTLPNGLMCSNECVHYISLHSTCPQGDLTRHGERKLAGLMKDGYNSAHRYLLNIFRDTYRQIAIGEWMSRCTFTYLRLSSSLHCTLYRQTTHTPTQHPPTQHSCTQHPPTLTHPHTHTHTLHCTMYRQTTYTHRYAHTHTHARAHTHVHKHIHTHTHTHMTIKCSL